MEARAVSRYNMISGRKARLVADLVRGKTVEEALHILALTQKKAAPIIQKTILSAVANLRQHDEAAGIPDDAFQVADVRVEDGPMLKRIMPRAQGRAYRVRRRMSHVKVTVTAEKP
jgi:large subunit ribosomal protein L22